MHHIDVYTLSTGDHDFCDIRPFVERHHIFEFGPRKLFASPLGRLNQLQRWRDLQRLDRLASQISREIDSRRYDVVFAQPCMWTQAPLVLRYLQTPTVYYCHEPPRTFHESSYQLHKGSSGWRSKLDKIDPLIPLYRSTARQLDQKAVRAARLVLVNSRFTQKRAKQIYGIDPVVNYHGVDTEVFCPQPRGGKSSYVLSVGAIQPHKGFDFLIESLGCVPKRTRPTLRLIGNVGNPGEQQLLATLAARHGVELSVEVRVCQATLVDRYCRAALVAYAPRNEPFGLVPLEAMACGTAVVGVREGGVQETIVHEHTGLLVERDPERFGAAIRQLLDNPALTAGYGRNGRRYVLDSWSWEQSVKQVQQNLSIAVH
jgi:glycosyltransferase involved in cell wall biosynthesis